MRPRRCATDVGRGESCRRCQDRDRTPGGL
jgi:hypothetical protein